MKLVDEKKAAVLAALGDDAHGLEKKDFVGNDLLSLLIRANMSSDMPEHARLTDEDILARESWLLLTALDKVLKSHRGSYCVGCRP